MIDERTLYTLHRYLADRSLMEMHHPGSFWILDAVASDITRTRSGVFSVKCCLNLPEQVRDEVAEPLANLSPLVRDVEVIRPAEEPTRVYLRDEAQRPRRTSTIRRSPG